jgi:cytochrome c oxidase assembly factor CtaG
VSAPRLPRMVIAAWAGAGLAIAALGVAVTRYLGESPSRGMGSMMDMRGAGAAFTREGSEPAGALLGSHLLTVWQLDPVALAFLALLGAAYLSGIALVRARTPDAPWPVRRTAAFFAGLLVCVFATCGSIAVYDQVLFTAHMIGHLALIMVAPALIVSGKPLSLAMAASSDARRAKLERVAGGRVVSLLTTPPVALASYAVVIVGSHLTGLMDVVMRRSWAGQVEHLVYLAVGIQFFVLVLGDEPIRWRLGTPARWLLLAVAMAVDTFTGVVLLQGTRAVGMRVDPRLSVDALSDTRTGGAIMWFGGDAIMAAIMIVLVIGWLRHVDTEKAEAKGWLEQARLAAFTEHTSAAPSVETNVETLDSDDAARESYNAWLANLDRRG